MTEREAAKALMKLAGRSKYVRHCLLFINAAAMLGRADEMQSALKVIHTWASVPGALDAEDVKRLCLKALGKL
ncbi:MAG: hypothetical protein HC794_01820 [Nitrospiraceae bacterium]|nr:hypothetical protein [Nitrospiraceae bacterium]